MANLKTNYKDDVLNTEVNERRKYQMIQNDDGTVSFVDVTDYSQVGDSFGALDINATNEKCNEINNSLGSINSNLTNLIDYDTVEVKLNSMGVSVIPSKTGYVPFFATVNNEGITNGIAKVYYSNGTWAVKVYDATSNNGAILTNATILGVYYIKMV